jgi:hypothetical protein
VSRRVEQKARARERIAAQRAAQARAERRRRVLIASGAIAVVIVVVGALVAVRLAVGGRKSDTGPSGAADTALVSALSSIPASTFDAVGTDAVQGSSPSAVSAPSLTADGKPKVLYIGAEFCLYCAAQRWPVAVALSRLGTFANLGTTHSAGNDVFPNTPTLSFHGVSYTSRYLALTGVETTTNEAVNGGYKPLDNPTAEDQKTFDTYNRPPYVKSMGSISFVAIGGKYVSSGASYSPELLTGKTQAAIAAALKDPADPIAKAVDGSANLYTAALCKLTGGQPVDVCGSPAVTAAAGKLGKS